MKLHAIAPWAISVTTALATTTLTIHNISHSIPSAFENIAVRSNGQILTTTSAPAAQVYQLDPLRIFSSALVTSFPGVQSALGIYELKPDVFYVATSNFSETTPSDGFPSTYQIFEVDVRDFAATPNGTVITPAVVYRVATLPNAGLLNGVTSIPSQSTFVLVADSFAGKIWRVDVGTGAVSTAFEDATTRVVKGASVPVGVNGIKVFGGDLYYTNTGTATLHKVPIGLSGYVSSCERPVLVTRELLGDDFIVDEVGTAYVASPGGEIYKVTPGGQKSIIAKDQAGPTALAFGRMYSDSMSVYVTTDGGSAKPQPLRSQGVSRLDVFELDS